MKNAVIFACAFALAACSSPSGGGSGTLPVSDVLPAIQRSIPGTYIKHIVIVVQENRSFNNLFQGFPGADTAAYGYGTGGKKIALHVTPFSPTPDLQHGYTAGYTDYDGGKMDGFQQENTYGGSYNPSDSYAYLPQTQVAPYWTMAKQYALLDHMFPMEFGPSFISHMTLIAGTFNLTPSLAEANYPFGYPWGCDAGSGTGSLTVNPQRQINVGPFPCFTQFSTMADTLDAKKVSWRYYAPCVSPPGPASCDYSGGLWTSFDAIKSVRYGPDWKRNIKNPETNVLTDPSGTGLASVSWVIPDWKNSDHPGAQSDYGPSWVAAVVNAIGESKDWSSTAIVVVWDDWGGWYDPIAPPQKDFRGLGMRVGCMVISPYVKPHVSHTTYEFGSVLRLVEEVFDLPTLASTGKGSGYTDTRGASMLGEFDFSQAPRKFVPIPAKYSTKFFLTKPASRHVVDEE